MRILGCLAAAIVLSAGVLGAAPAVPRDTRSQGLVQRITCLINRDRVSRYLSPVFLHRTLSDVALTLGERYEAGTLDSGTFNQLVTSQIAPLGSSVRTSYNVLGSFTNDQDYVEKLEHTIYDQLFERTLDAIGVSESNGTYTIVLASGLAQRPQAIESCPTGTDQFSPSDGDTGSNVANGVELPQFLCAINSRRAHAHTDAFVVHRALANEAQAQVEQMDRLGHYTVNGPRKVDKSLYGAGVNVKSLYWMAGDTYHGATSLVDLLNANYASSVTNPEYSVIGVAQKNGYWSVILASLYRTVQVYKPCPLSLDDVDYTS